MVKETKPKDYQARTIYREALPGPMVSECKSWRSGLESDRISSTRCCRRRIYLID
jgi:hypothetical protein